MTVRTFASAFADAPPKRGSNTVAELWLGLAVIALSVCMPFVVFAAKFPDVPQTNPNALAIQTLKDAQIISGYGDGTFKPDKRISRAEAVAIILKASGTQVQKSSQKLSFTDVSENDWFFPMIQKGVALGKLKGYSDNTFRPAQAVTLPEAVTLTLSFFNISTKNITRSDLEFDKLYAGLVRSEWYAKQMLYAKNQNLFEPDSQGIINPAAPLTRGALAEIVYRMRQTSQTKSAFDITTGWITTENQENFWKLKHPADWEVFKGQKNSVIWKRSKGAVFFSRLWPDTVKLSISIADNSEKLTAEQYFARFDNNYTSRFTGHGKSSHVVISGRPGIIVEWPDYGIFDAAIHLPNGSFLVLNGDYGSAPIGKFFKKHLETVIATYQFVEAPKVPPLPPLEDRLATLRESLLVYGKWKDVAPLFPDKKLIETDAIGIGTGPVDYYYSKEANQTIKLERNSGTVLNMRESQTSGF